MKAKLAYIANFTGVGNDPTTEARQHNYVNQITRITDTVGGTPTPTPFSYDHGSNTGDAALQGNGNIVNDGVRIYQYDAFNRVIQVTSVATSEVIATYVYDAFNRRVQKTISNGGITGDVTNGVNNFYYDGQQLIEKRSGATPDNWGQLYFWGQYIDELLFFAAATEEGGDTFRVLSDLLYRTTAVVNTSNGIFEAFDCDAYGNTICYSGPGDDGIWFTDDDVQTNNPVNSTIFTGRRYDIETQLYYYRARIYSPQIGRFISRDPIGFAGGMNLYAYCGGNAVNGLDPMGWDATPAQQAQAWASTLPSLTSTSGPSAVSPLDSQSTNRYAPSTTAELYNPSLVDPNVAPVDNNSPSQQTQNWGNSLPSLTLNLPDLSNVSASAALSNPSSIYTDQDFYCPFANIPRQLPIIPPSPSMIQLANGASLIDTQAALDNWMTMHNAEMNSLTEEQVESLVNLTPLGTANLFIQANYGYKVIGNRLIDDTERTSALRALIYENLPGEGLENVKQIQKVDEIGHLWDTPQ